MKSSAILIFTASTFQYNKHNTIHILAPARSETSKTIANWLQSVRLVGMNISGEWNEPSTEQIDLNMREVPVGDSLFLIYCWKGERLLMECEIYFWRLKRFWSILNETGEQSSLSGLLCRSLGVRKLWIFRSMTVEYFILIGIHRKGSFTSLHVKQWK